MTRQELKARLDAEGFRSDAYILDGSEPPYEALVLREEGEQWHVYYVERGIWRARGEFDTEHDACVFLYEALCKDVTSKM